MFRHGNGGRRFGEKRELWIENWMKGGGGRG